MIPNLVCMCVVDAGVSWVHTSLRREPNHATRGGGLRARRCLRGGHRWH